MTLYHYTSGQGVYGIIHSKQLHCSNVIFLNDPTELKHFRKIIEKVFKECSLCEKIYEILVNETYYEVMLDFYDKYIASFSKNRDSLSMWFNYAKGNGYSIGFDVDSIIEKYKNNNAVKISKVELIYNEAEQIKKAKEFIVSFKSKWECYNDMHKQNKKSSSDTDFYDVEAKFSQIKREFNNGILELMTSFKHEAYENEKEVRLIISQSPFKKLNPNKSLSDEDKNALPVNFKISENGVFVEYASLDIDINNHIKSITLHPLNNELHLQSVRNFISCKIGFKVKVYQSEAPYRST